MKKENFNFTTSIIQFIILSLIGLGGLILSGIKFDLPPYAQGIFALIIGIFSITQVQYLRSLIKIKKEYRSLGYYNKRDILVANPDDDDTIVSKRVKKLTENQNNIMENVQVLDQNLQDDLLSLLGFSKANLVITLGLLGTFVGLMFAISEAGNSFDSKGIEGVVNAIFKDMKGIFGSSISGLIAFMVLTVSYNMLQRILQKFHTSVSDFTQFTIIPKLSSEKFSMQEKLLDSIESMNDKFTAFESGIRSLLVDESKQNFERMENIVQSTFEKTEETLSKSSETFVSSINDSYKEASKSYLSEIQTQSDSISKNHQDILGEFKSQIQEYSNQFMDQQKANLQEINSSISPLIEHLNKTVDALPATFSEINNEQKSLLESNNEKIREALHTISLSFESNMNKNTDALNTSIASLSNAVDGQVDKLTGVISEIPKAQEELQKQNNEAIASQLKHIEDQNQQSFIHNKTYLEDVFVKMNEFITDLKQTTEEISRESFGNLIQEFASLLEATKENFEFQSNITKSINEQYQDQIEIIKASNDKITESSDLMKINQVEFQSNLEMFNEGINGIIEFMKSNHEDDSSSLLEKLETSLSNFQEKASEILIENALRTQEILLEILERQNAVEMETGEEA